MNDSSEQHSPALGIIEVPLAVNDARERRVELDGDGHALVVTLDVETLDVRVMVVVTDGSIIVTVLWRRDRVAIILVDHLGRSQL